MLRVDFLLEKPDEPSTTGVGKFDLRQAVEDLPDYTYLYDPPPHNRAYFEHHLEALRRYYAAVSEGRVGVEFSVFPTEMDAAYTLPLNALTYGNGRTPEEITDKWLQLIADAVAQAQEDSYGPDFSQYDSFLLIHAGAGHESGQLNDIRSVFLSRADIVEHGGSPVTVDGIEIEEAWILPESINAEGRAGLNGLMAKFFGHQLGLPGLSNFADGLPAVGGWSLMDVGPNRLGFVLQGSELQPLFGFVPPHPIAWCKVRLGWIDPLVVRRDTTVTVVATDRFADHGQHKAVQVPISTTEYFLLENRQRRGRADLPDGVDTPFPEIDITWIDTKQIEFSNTSNADAAMGSETGVWLGVDEYDAFLPGSGILIWHVDDAIIAAQEMTGAINNDRVTPGIVLEEADGERDIGNAFFERQKVTEGSVTDPFFAGEGRDGVRSQTRFGPDTTPNTSTNTGIPSGVQIEILSTLGDTMTIRVRFGGVISGWPALFPGGRRLQAVDLNDNGAYELILETASSVNVFIDGEATPKKITGGRLLTASPTAIFSSSSGTVSAHTLDGGDPLWSTDLDTETHTAVYNDRFGRESGSVLAVASTREVWLIDAESGEWLTRHETAGILGLGLRPVVDGTDELIATASDAVYAVGTEGVAKLWPSEAGKTLIASAAGDFNGDGNSDIAVLTSEGQVISVIDGTLNWQTSVGSPVGAPSLGDVDGNGLLEIVVATETGVAVLQSTGKELASFPVVLRRHQNLGSPVGEPLLADLDDDGMQEIVFAVSSGALVALDSDGRQLAGYPVMTQAPVYTTPVVVDLDGDNELEVAAIAGDFVYAWNPSSVAPSLTGGSANWGQGAATASGSRARTGISVIPLRGTSLLLSGAYCYPNPVGPSQQANLRYFLNGPADLQLEVFDAVGTRIERRRWGRVTQTAPGENEITWTTENYDSGLYLCRLEARGVNGRRDHVIVRMAVVR